MNTYPAYPDNRFGSQVKRAVLRARDWLDEHGRLAWIAAMIAGFVLFWPLGLFILGYMIWSNRMFGGCHSRARSFNDRRTRFAQPETTGNAAFDAYRDETLKRLEDEHRAFVDFLQKLREARDKAEFDQFMEERKQG
ncbi:DUF2852 domain-containing protein [Paracoccus sp. Z118]|uniref:DUF2852 domain-containing protein n=1 Tax=Paracoccus sp. Z118 TaxID=2851017 RepID=UPI0020B72655|nr:DUF2852 domain-containing protein [Paracoccus sp. Z118]